VNFSVCDIWMTPYALTQIFFQWSSSEREAHLQQESLVDRRHQQR